MASVTEISQATADLPEGRPYLLSSEDYFRMVESDIIPSDRRVGLWNGRLYEKETKTLLHAVTQSLIAESLMRTLPEGWCPWIGSTIRVDDFTAPFPEMSIISGPVDSYLRRNSWPGQGEIGLVVEVADTSLKKT